MSENKTEIRLTSYAHGAGCGCKIAPQVLREILQNDAQTDNDPRLLVGNSHNDDAAVYDLGNDQALISTTDFFMPIVDDAFDFGRIAAANAISDVYAMGGRPVLALAVLGWPVDKLPAALARRVLDGARAICAEAGIVLAGGHSIDSPEPVFGLSVNGLVALNELKRNNSAEDGDLIFLTKPLGSGIVSTAMKKGLLEMADRQQWTNNLLRLNSLGEKLGKLRSVSAMTDVTGFGLLGHLIEMAEGSGFSAEIRYNDIPLLPAALKYVKLGAVPDATYRNWNAYNAKTQIGAAVDPMESFMLLPDPQTNGGLLFAVKKDGLDEVCRLLQENGLEAFAKPIGQFIPQTDKTVYFI